jgi:hypothetical protein
MIYERMLKEFLNGSEEDEKWQKTDQPSGDFAVSNESGAMKAE